MIIRIVVITGIGAIAGAVMIGAVVVPVVIIKFSPAVVTHTHTDGFILVILFLCFVAVIIILLFVHISYRRIIDIIRRLTAFIGGTATAESGYR